MAKIICEDGSIIEGKGFGYQGIAFGELVFNTGMTGYQEILTDPSYAGQVVTMTYPLIGNYGINGMDFESKSSQVAGLIVKEYSKAPSHWQLEYSLHDYLINHKIVGIWDVDTRMITKRIRTIGSMNCVISNDDSISDDYLIKALKSFVFPAKIVARVSLDRKTTYTLNDAPSKWHLDTLSPKGKDQLNKVSSGQVKHIALVDLGVKDGIIKQLVARGFKVSVMPYNIGIHDLDLDDLHALMFSNGPGDPKECLSAIQLAKDIKGRLPMLGICLGHQILALSLGADTYKMKFGHRGANHPVMDLSTGKVFMTSQNHGYAVVADKLPKAIAITHVNVNDETVEGLSCEEAKIASVQFHPEEGPGPTDASLIFDQWLDLIKGGDA